jgi:hypothetical protein
MRGVACVLRILTLFTVLVASVPALADGDKVDIELNSIGPRNDTCEVYLRVRNQSSMAFSSFKIDLAFFTRNGIINDRSLVELGPLRAQKTSLHVFQMPDMDCADVGEVLLNDVTDCTVEGEGQTPGDCLSLVTLSAKGDLSFIR